MRDVSFSSDRPVRGACVAFTVTIAIILVSSLPGTARANPSPAPFLQQQAVERAAVQVPSSEDADMVLDLPAAIDIALDRSFAIYQLQQNFLQTSYSLEYWRRSLRTRIDFSSSLPSITQGVNPTFYTDQSGNPIIDYLRSSRTNMWGNIRILQPLITNGNVSVNMRMYANESWNELTGDRPRVENRSLQPSVGIQLTQPLFQYNQIRGDLLQNELSVESVELGYTESELSQINQVSGAFYNLLRQQRQVEIRAESYRQSEINYNTGRRRYQSAQGGEIDVLRAEVQMSNALSSLESAKTTLDALRFTFNRLIGLPIETVVWVEADLEYRPIEVDLERALELALEYRSDIRQQEIQLEQSDLSLRETVSNGRPNLQMSLGYDLTGTSTLTGLGYDNSWSDHLSAAFDSDNRSPNWNVGLTLQIPIFDWGRNQARVEGLLAGMAVTQRRILEAEANLRVTVINQVSAVEGAMQQLEILEENRQIARMVYDISQQQYERGEMDLDQLLNIQTNWMNTELSHLQAWIDFEMAKADLKEITLWDWETNQPVVRRTNPPRPFEKD